MDTFTYTYLATSMQSVNSFFILNFRPFFHGKSYLEAVMTCHALGSEECPSKLLPAETVPFVDSQYDPLLLPEFSRINAIYYMDQWFDEDTTPVNFPGKY